MKFHIYGKILLANRSEKGWSISYVGDEGKSRPADDLIVPDFIEEDELEDYLSDICHEWVSDKHPNVYRILNETD